MATEYHNSKAPVVRRSALKRATMLRERGYSSRSGYRQWVRTPALMRPAFTAAMRSTSELRAVDPRRLAVVVVAPRLVTLLALVGVLGALDLARVLLMALRATGAARVFPSSGRVAAAHLRTMTAGAEVLPALVYAGARLEPMIVRVARGGTADPPLRGGAV